VDLDLKDKIGTTGFESQDGNVLLHSSHSEAYEEAIAALSMLGFPQAPSQKVVTSILKEEPNLTVEKVIKLALKRL
jgi:Holliday junction DNA helicase RuvA